MSENINFIPANKLPEAENYNVSVLCVENGELKQKAASGLSGDTNYDIAVHVIVTRAEEGEDVYMSATCEILSGSYDAVIQKLDAGIMPVGLCIEESINWEGNCSYKYVEEFLPVWFNRPREFGEYILIQCGYAFLLLPDGTVILD